MGIVPPFLIAAGWIRAGWFGRDTGRGSGSVGTSTPHNVGCTAPAGAAPPPGRVRPPVGQRPRDCGWRGRRRVSGLRLNPLRELVEYLDDLSWFRPAFGVEVDAPLIEIAEKGRQVGTPVGEPRRRASLHDRDHRLP